MRLPASADHVGRNRLIVLGLAAALFAAVAVSFALGRFPIAPDQVLGILLSKLFPIEPYWTGKMETIFFNVRLPRVALACLVGCCLSAAGAAYQGIFQNPMASPDLLGASAGASFGAALAIFHYAGSRMTTVCAFGFSLLSVALVWLVSQRAKGKKVLSLILAGIMVSSLFQAATSFIKLVADPNDQLPQITFWLMGGLSAVKLGDLTFALIPMGAGLAVLFVLRWRINVLTMGDDEARTMGVNAKSTRLAVILTATLITAASVAVSGTIGWVGLVVPHLARRLVGNNYRHLMPASMLFGAIFLLVVDNISRNLLATELPLGILTAFVGAPFFLYLIMRGGEGA